MQKLKVVNSNVTGALIVYFSSPFFMYVKPQSDPKLALDIRGADRKPGARVILYSNKGDLADNQLWYEDERGVIRSKLNGFAIDSSGSLVTYADEIFAYRTYCDDIMFSCLFSLIHIVFMCVYFCDL